MRLWAPGNFTCQRIFGFPFLVISELIFFLLAAISYKLFCNRGIFLFWNCRQTFLTLAKETREGWFMSRRLEELNIVKFGLKWLSRYMITIFKHINTREKQKCLIWANRSKSAGSGRKISKTQANYREKIPCSGTSLKNVKVQQCSSCNNVVKASQCYKYCKESWGFPIYYAQVGLNNPGKGRLDSVISPYKDLEAVQEQTGWNLSVPISGGRRWPKERWMWNYPICAPSATWMVNALNESVAALVTWSPHYYFRL